MQAACPPAIVTPEIEVVRAAPETATDFTIPISGLTQMAGRAGQGIEVRGLTSNRLERSISLKFEGRSLPGDATLFCYRLVKARVEIRPLSTVYVASEYPPESCAWRAVLEHENRHVTGFTDALWRYRAQVRDAVWTSVWKLGVIGPFRQDEFGGHAEELRARVNDRLAEHDENLLSRDRGLQDKVDNSGEYENVARHVDECLRKDQYGP